MALDAHATYRANHVVIENLVAGAVRKYFPRTNAATQDDLMQAGRIGAYLGIQRYDASRGNSLHSWLYTYVRAAVIDAIRQILGRQGRTPHKLRQGRPVVLEPKAVVKIAGSYRVDGAYVARDQLRVMCESPDAELLVRHAAGNSLTELGAERGLSRSRMCRILAACRRAM